MIAISSALILIFTILVARGVLFARTPPLDPVAPLNVDDGIPFPEAGQASSVFSLTALFGAYLTLVIVLGIPAGIGLAAGTVSGLAYIRFKLVKWEDPSFDSLLARVLGDGSGTSLVMVVVISGTQLLLACSEFVLLEAIYTDIFGHKPSYALLFTSSVALIGYMYCLNGAYLAVFRTDIVQFGFLLIMLIAVFWSVVADQAVDLTDAVLFGMRPALWVEGLVDRETTLSIALTWAATVIITFIMGFGYIVASPDTWKRVHLVNRAGEHRFWLLVASGVAPFFVVLPILPIIDQSFLTSTSSLRVFIDYASMQHEAIFTLIFVGFLSSFLSSFDSCLINICHVFQQGTREPNRDIRAFQKTIALSFTAIFLISIGITAISTNPYSVASVLIMSFAFISAYLVGSDWGSRKIKAPFFTGLLVIVLGGWTVYLTQHLALFEKPTIDQLHLVPIAAIAFVGIAAAVFLLSREQTT